MKRIIATLAMACVPAMAQQAEPFTPQQLKAGATSMGATARHAMAHACSTRRLPST
jgi:hypothetical protein